MTDLRKFEREVEDLEGDTIIKWAKHARYYADLALSTAQGSPAHKDAAESLDVIVTMLKDLIDPDWDAELRELMEGNGG